MTGQGNPFDDAHRDFYDEHGYLLARGFFDAAELAPWRERFIAVVEGGVLAADGMLVMQDVMVAKGAVAPTGRAQAIAKIQDFHNDPVLFEGYAKHSRLLDKVSEFIGPDIKSIHTMLINKPPGVDGRHPLHQDLLYFPFRPADSIVATWTAIDPCTRENGCLAIVPGSHRSDLLAHENVDWEYVNFGYFGAAGVGPATDRLHLEMQPGDTLFFHPLLLHGSGRNRSNGFRRGISAHYASSACRYLPGAEPIGDGRPYTLVRGRAHRDGI